MSLPIPDIGAILDQATTAIDTKVFDALRAKLNVESTLRSQSTTALETNRAFLTVPSPTQAQTLAQVRALSRQNNVIIRLLLGDLTGTD